MAENGQKNVASLYVPIGVVGFILAGSFAWGLDTYVKQYQAIENKVENAVDELEHKISNSRQSCETRYDKLAEWSQRNTLDIATQSSLNSERFDKLSENITDVKRLLEKMQENIDRMARRNYYTNTGDTR